MSKGLWVYTVGLFIGAILALVLTVPHHSIFAGLAVLGIGAAVLAAAMGRDFKPAESRSDSNADRER